MSVFVCNECGNYFDSDYYPCLTDPRDDCACICEECAEKLGVEDE